jgi:integrase
VAATVSALSWNAAPLGEVRAVLERMDGVEALVAGLQYGSGMRLLEALRLRVKDLVSRVNPFGRLASIKLAGEWI